MPDFPELPIIPPSKNPFPELPVITPDPPRKSLREKYGGLYYLGIAGLVVSLFLVTSFAYGVWALRDIWTAVYTLHHDGRSEPDRIRSAWAIARHPSVNDRQRSDMALRKTLPKLARYVLAESLTSESIQADPKGYALMVARSEGWPDWFRLLMARPMAYGVGEGYQISWEPLDQLRQHKDPAIALWATYTRAAMAPGNPQALKALQEAAARGDRYSPLAALLEAAALTEGADRVEKLDEATRWLRDHHPEAIEIWKGWAEKDGKLVQVPGEE
ncbi:hypothetical protein P12x_004510 [Tundrisphaera lichenicola]|uniref:hypothetical protein n=1 Tax=Tundrisphaera lichenicola TaxID=2029860 RepID=UPI003EB9FAD0